MMTNDGKLMAYMMGWRAGANGATINSEQSQHHDFMLGHKAGREAVQEAYGKAQEKYRAVLSPLRS